MTRQQPALRPPAAEDATAVPVTHRRVPLHRCVDERYEQPHRFSSRDRTDHPSRFDLTAPHGTCYYARQPVTAVLEVLVDPDDVRPHPLTREDLAGLDLWECEPVGRRGELADTTVPSVPGLTGELATVVPYDLPWAWADAFHDAGRVGLVYRARLGSGEAVALFGPSGVPGGPSPADGRAARSAAVEVYDDLPARWRSDDTGGRDLDLADLDRVRRVPAAGSTAR